MSVINSGDHCELQFDLDELSPENRERVASSVRDMALVGRVDISHNRWLHVAPKLRRSLSEARINEALHTLNSSIQETIDHRVAHPGRYFPKAVITA